MNPARFPTHLVILGGGSAGWMSAAYLDRAFNAPDRRRLPITVVESPAIGRIGVGEATVPTILGFTRNLGIDESTFMKRTQATFKHGVLFRDWNGPGTSYFHGFQAFNNFNGFNPAPSWLARRHAGVAGPFDEESGVQKEIAFDGRAPKKMMDPDYGGLLPYAYHLDAEAYGDLLRDLAVARGVNHIEGLVKEVLRDETGAVSGLRLDDGRTVEGDFFVDCSGFRALLLQETLGAGFESFASSLACDRAVALPIPHEGDETPQPFTISQAMDAGWMWRIGLQNRLGTGYVYSSEYLAPEEAEADLRRVANAPESATARHLEMRIGIPKVTWKENVVGIGLTGGFIEPLESTGLHMVELALEFLLRYFPLSGLNAAARDRFNSEMARLWYELRDFVFTHYCLSKRRDTPFWRDTTDPVRIPPSLAARLAVWEDRHPADLDVDNPRVLFSYASWQAIIYGLDAAGENAMANAAHWCRRPGAHLGELRHMAGTMLEELPSQKLWLEGLRTIPERPIAELARPTLRTGRM